MRSEFREKGFFSYRGPVRWAAFFADHYFRFAIIMLGQAIRLQSMKRDLDVLILLRHYKNGVVICRVNRDMTHVPCCTSYAYDSSGPEVFGYPWRGKTITAMPAVTQFFRASTAVFCL